MQLETFPSEQKAATEIDLFPFQAEVVLSDVRHRVQVSGRRTGKSYTDIASGFEHASAVQDARVLFIGPTIGQAEEAFWPTLLDMTRDTGLLSRPPRETTHDLFFNDRLNNARFTLKSADKPDTLRGISPTPTLIILDELALFDPKLYPEIIRPMTLDPIRKPRILVSSTPKGKANLLYQMYLWGQDPERKEWASWQFRAIDVRPDMKEEIEALREELDPVTFDQEVNATFLSTAGGVFTSFDPDINVRSDLADFAPGEAVHVAIDFNVNIMAACAIAVRKMDNGAEHYHILREWTGSSNTDALAQKIKAELPGRHLYAYPDPSGAQRKTNSPTGVTDHSILRDHGFEVRTRRRTPPLRDSVNAVNRLLRSAAGTSRMFVRDTCKQVILSLENTEWRRALTGEEADVATIDKRAGVEHHGDGIRYLVEYCEPIRRQGVSIANVDLW